MIRHRVGRVLTLGFVAGAVLTSSALGGAHTWRVHEIYSNADGTVQFIELRETCGGANETLLGATTVKSNANTVNLANLPAGTSADKFLLVGTANLPDFGGPTPDFIIPANFFSLVGDVVQYTPYHSCSVASGSVPTDGSNSLHRALTCAGTVCPVTEDLNSPTNYAGETGTLVLPGDPPVPTVSQWGLGVMLLLLLTAGTLIATRRLQPAV